MSNHRISRLMRREAKKALSGYMAQVFRLPFWKRVAFAIRVILKIPTEV